MSRYTHNPIPTIYDGHEAIESLDPPSYKDKFLHMAYLHNLAELDYLPYPQIRKALSDAMLMYHMDLADVDDGKYVPKQNRFMLMFYLITRATLDLPEPMVTLPIDYTCAKMGISFAPDMITFLREATLLDMHMFMMTFLHVLETLTAITPHLYVVIQLMEYRLAQLVHASVPQIALNKNTWVKINPDGNKQLNDTGNTWLAWTYNTIRRVVYIHSQLQSPDTYHLRKVYSMPVVYSTTDSKYVLDAAIQPEIDGFGKFLIDRAESLSTAEQIDKFRDFLRSYNIDIADLDTYAHTYAKAGGANKLKNEDVVTFKGNPEGAMEINHYMYKTTRIVDFCRRGLDLKRSRTFGGIQNDWLMNQMALCYVWVYYFNGCRNLESDWGTMFFCAFRQSSMGLIDDVWTAMRTTNPFIIARLGAFCVVRPSPKQNFDPDYVPDPDEVEAMMEDNNNDTLTVTACASIVEALVLWCKYILIDKQGQILPNVNCRRLLEDVFEFK